MPQRECEEVGLENPPAILDPKRAKGAVRLEMAHRDSVTREHELLIGISLTDGPGQKDVREEKTERLEEDSGVRELSGRVGLAVPDEERLPKKDVHEFMGHLDLGSDPILEPRERRL